MTKGLLLLFVLSGVASAQAPTRHIPIRKEQPKVAPPETVTVVKTAPPEIVMVPAPPAPPDTVRRVDTLTQKRWLLIPFPLIFWSAAHDDDRAGVAGPPGAAGPPGSPGLPGLPGGPTTLTQIWNYSAFAYYYSSYTSYSTTNTFITYACGCWERPLPPPIDAEGCRTEEEHQHRHPSHWTPAPPPPTTATPEPVTLVLVASGLAVVGGLARRRRSVV